VVRRLALFAARRLAAPDVHAAIDLAGIRGYDFAAIFFGEPDCERGFAARGRADDHDDLRLRSGIRIPRRFPASKICHF
jgi:hypothetical protein